LYHIANNLRNNRTFVLCVRDDIKIQSKVSDAEDETRPIVRKYVIHFDSRPDGASMCYISSKRLFDNIDQLIGYYTSKKN
jgi:hypothetical protein